MHWEGLISSPSFWHPAMRLRGFCALTMRLCTSLHVCQYMASPAALRGARPVAEIPWRVASMHKQRAPFISRLCICFSCSVLHAAVRCDRGSVGRGAPTRRGTTSPIVPAALLSGRSHGVCPMPLVVGRA
eukprot:TRINITY_DN1044_c1_g1_i1.p2 TRINITY_DN1044_c1_g1~~TRINITY_DN1044_c1_g1_i1.p2  ORF type:complete len:130 (+),score=0.54 TRINITY_DN1044_c1_g1_i1:461-850(+)